LKKIKLKRKGKKLYKNTQGKMCRVASNYKKRNVIRKRKTLRYLEAQVEKLLSP